MLWRLKRKKEKLSIYSVALLLGSLIAFWYPATSNALYHNPDVERIERRIQITAVNDTEVEVQIIDLLKNTTDAPQYLEYFYPLPLHAQEPKFFVDAQAIPYEIETETERLNMLFDQAQKHHDSRFFRLGSPLYAQLFHSSPVILNHEEEIRVKLTWNMSSEFVNDFHFLEIFTDDGISTQLFEIIFSLATQEPIWHFFTNIQGESMTEKDQHQVVTLSQQKEHTPEQNLRIFWSHVENPTLQYLTDETIYYGHFDTWKSPKNIEEVVFLIDTSGSMSDNIWDQTVKHLNFLLEKLEGMRVKILLVDEDIRAYEEEFQENTRQFLRDFMEFTESLRPVGKTDIQNGILSITEDSWSVPRESRAIVLITDKELTIPEQIDQISAPVITLHFTSSSAQNADLISYLTDGFAQRLFRSAHTLVEADELWSKWQHWTNPKHSDQIPKYDGETDLLPDQFTGKFAQQSPFFIGRKFDSYATKYTAAADFLTRRWAGLRLAQILKTQETSLTDFEAMASIAKRFGIQTPYFDPNSPAADIQNTVENLSLEERIKLIQTLENSEPQIPPNTKFHNSIPLTHAATDFVWQSYDFQSKATEENLLAIAPFSAAQQQLFLQFPEFLATGFGIGEQTEFCTFFRCISVRYGYKETPELSDRAFLSDFDPHHWANPYILQLVKRGIFKPSLNGKIHADRAIDRGEFIRMAYEIQKQNNQLRSLQAQTPLFSDIQPDSAYFQAAQHYASTGVIKGYKDQTFRPYLELTRAEAIKILLSIQGVTPIQLKGQEPVFTDTVTWEQPWIEEAFHRGLVSGFPDGTFRPHHNMTRGSAVKLLVETLLNSSTQADK